MCTCVRTHIHIQHCYLILEFFDHKRKPHTYYVVSFNSLPLHQCVVNHLSDICLF